MTGTRRLGLLLALLTALISGVSVFLNSYGVKSFGNPALYTTAKNLVAGIGLLAVVGLLVARAPRGRVLTPPRTWRQGLGLATVAVVGGTVPFVLFFEGLAKSGAPAQAAFIQKTLVFWVALLAVPLLRERLRPIHVAAIALLITGQAALAGGIAATFDLRGDQGQWLILAATVMWAVEVVVARPLLGAVSSWTVGLTRMLGGSVLLVAWAALHGQASALLRLSAADWGWVVGTGLLLAAYVGTWFAALARAPAIDVTAILVLGAVVTAGLSTGIAGAALHPIGLVMVLGGTALVAARLWRGRPALTGNP